MTYGSYKKGYEKMLWNVNRGYLQAVKFYDNLKFMNYTIMYVPHVLHIPFVGSDHWGGKAQAGILKVGKLRLTGK